MADVPPVPSQSDTSESRIRSTLIFGAFGLLAAIVFGLIYLFVLAPSVPDASFGWYLFSFAVGLTMIVLPCTLPLAFVIVPLSMGKGMLRGLGMALAFGTGVAVTLSLYGVAAALLGGLAIDALGADLEALKNWVYFIAGIFAFLFALGELGLINVHMPTYSGAAPAFIQKRGELIKAFLLGLFLGNVGVGCPHPATPLILIEIASSGDILYGWSLFLVHAVGRVLPLLLLAFLAILGVNGLNWLLARKDAVQRFTGWAMVFVAGFILTLGLFTHDWWVNSGLHSGLETLTQEHRFNALLNETLGTDVAHVHGLEEGAGLFGLPLEWGSWFLVVVWLIPIWWWWLKKRNAIKESPAFALERLQHELDTVEDEIRSIESATKLDELDSATDLTALEGQMDEIKKQRRALTKKVNYGETGVYKDPAARTYEVKILGMHRNYLIVISIFLALTFIYFLPENFFLKATHPDSGVHDHGAAEDAPTGTPFDRSAADLPEAEGPELVELSDGDTYDIVAEYVLKEVGNRTLRMLAYNRSVPGPMISVPQGAEITINFTNNTDVDQTIHSHGIRIDNRSDGVPYLTQDPVQPGESFTYTVRFEDAGAYWYHPHTREDYGQELGLYGNYLVEPSDPDYWSPVNREMPLVIDDILIENDDIAEFYREFTNFALLGRFGNEHLVNGERDYTTTVRAGEVIRFFVTNVANTRVYNISIPGAELKRVGSDLSKFERETYEDTLLISPAERLVVEAYFPEAGTYNLMHTTPDGEAELARFLALEETPETSYVDEFNTLRTNTDVVDEFTVLRTYQNTTPDKELLLTIDLSGDMVDHSAHAHHDDTGADHADHGDTHGSAPAVDHSEHAHMDADGGRLGAIQWDDPGQTDRINTTDTILWQLRDATTGKMNMDIDDWTFTDGDLVKVRLTNDAEADHVMQHPIHFHGQRFVILSEDGEPNENLAWKDTVLVLPGETVDVLVEMGNPGEWMAHCHIAEHLHAGMMLSFRVENPDGSAPGDDYRATVDESQMQHMHSDGSMHDHSAAMPDGDISSSRQEVPAGAYEFSDVAVEDPVYSVSVNNRFTKVGREEQLQLSFSDAAGDPVNLDGELGRALTVTFVKSDDSIRFVTYPGNSVFPEIETDDHDHDDDHDDDHDHSHSWLMPNTAHAHGDNVEDGHHAGGVGRTYTLPAVFPTEGVYRGFVEFVLEGETEPRVATFDVEVSAGTFSVDNFGWSDTTKWWVLLVGSLVLIVPLVWIVRRYINVENV